MPKVSPLRYYAAVAASGVSTVAWLGTVVGVIATIYAAAAGGPALEVLRWTGVLLVVGIAFALLEKQLYRMDRQN